MDAMTILTLSHHSRKIGWMIRGHTVLIYLIDGQLRESGGPTDGAHRAEIIPTDGGDRQTCSREGTGTGRYKEPGGNCHRKGLSQYQIVATNSQ